MFLRCFAALAFAVLAYGAAAQQQWGYGPSGIVGVVLVVLLILLLMGRVLTGVQVMYAFDRSGQ